MEVYVLFKELGATKYSRSDVISHHIVLLKHNDGTFYSSDLDVDSKGGPCQLHFDQYEFLDNRPIYYKPFGRTKKSLNEIIQWIQQHKMAGIPYKVGLDDCRRYAAEFIVFLNTKYTARSEDAAYMKVDPVAQYWIRMRDTRMKTADSPADLSLS